MTAVVAMVDGVRHDRLLPNASTGRSGELTANVAFLGFDLDDLAKPKR